LRVAYSMPLSQILIILEEKHMINSANGRCPPQLSPTKVVLIFTIHFF